MRRRSLFHLAFAAALLFAGASCLSPTIPLPPPDEPDNIQPLSDELWAIGGVCTPGAVVTIFNENTGEGVIVEDRDQIGRYHVELQGTLCDLVRITEEVSSETSLPTTFVLEPGPPPKADSVCK